MSGICTHLYITSPLGKHFTGIVSHDDKWQKNKQKKNQKNFLRFTRTDGRRRRKTLLPPLKQKRTFLQKM